jgi:hypothetical protein
MRSRFSTRTWRKTSPPRPLTSSSAKAARGHCRADVNQLTTATIAVERSRYKRFVPSRRFKKTLIARCMIGKSRQTRISRFEGAYYAQYRFSCRSCGSSRSHLFVARTGDSRERSNRRWRRRRTYRRCIARWGPGVTPCSAAGLLCAGAGIRRRACVPVRSRTLLGRLRLGIPPRRGLRLIVRCTDYRLPRKCEERTTLARPFE